jgi:serine/threonine-protein kinase
MFKPKQAEVPNVVGRRSATASQILQNRGFEVNIENVRSDSVPSDRVATQRPQPKQRAREGSTVTIIVSSGPGDATIPFVRGSPRAQAERRLKAAGFRVDVRREFSDTVPVNKVIETSPSERSPLQRGSTVTLVVSRGARKVQVPDVVGSTTGEARALLEGRGLQVSLTEREVQDKPAGTVLDQSPAAGASIQKGGTVKLTVAKAPPQVKVPDVIDDTVDDAVAALEQAGFKVRRRPRKVDSPDDDKVVLDQNPPADEKQDKGTRVTITVGRFTPPNLDPEPSATSTPSPTP